MLTTPLGSYITHDLHEAAPTAPTDSLHSSDRRALTPLTPIPLLTPMSPPRHPLLRRSPPLMRTLEETVDSKIWKDTISAIRKDRIRKEIDDGFRLGVITRRRDSEPHPPGQLQVEARATVLPGLLLAMASSTVPPALMSSAGLPRHIQHLVHTPPEPIDTTISWSYMDISHYASIYYVELPISLKATAMQTLGRLSEQVEPSATGHLSVEGNLWLKGSIRTGLGETKARSAVYWRSASSSERDKPQHLEQYDQLEAVEWEVVQGNQADALASTFNTPPATNPEPVTAQKSALVIRQFASGFFDIIGSQLVLPAVQGV